jgi:putative nucleotidyltransferase with HDIG domain
MGLLHLFEMLFGITTNITLLELSDLNNPILKDLILKAPGTYHHSLIVGNLAEAACDAISANSLLARVGAYYHDIGKIEKAEYFSENEIEAKSRHEALTPTMSALIIINHVKDGIEVARKHNLPASILDFITQHHGTGLIYFFYQRALEKNGDESFLKEEDFRYPGPKPQTKEAAVVLLADAVEASSRTLSDPTPARIQALTQRIINNKFIDGQLDECDLSLKDLNKIAMSFARILTGIFHSRVEYPAVSSSTA